MGSKAVKTFTFTHTEVFGMARRLADRLIVNCTTYNYTGGGGGPDRMLVHGIPRGGVAVCYLLGGIFTALNRSLVFVDDPKDADVIVDDLLDSGATRDAYRTEYPDTPFYVLYIKREDDPWIVFPWEAPAERTGPADAVTRLLEYVGEDPNRDGLRETPRRVLEAWKFWTSGYGQNPSDMLTTFDADFVDASDEMITVRDIPFYSHCEHHLAPFFGTVTISYIPNLNSARVVGLSKLARIVDVYSRRLQVQERLTAEIQVAIRVGLMAEGVGVMVRARHLCMESRGVSKQGQETITTSLAGVIKDNGVARNEFLKII